MDARRNQSAVARPPPTDQKKGRKKKDDASLKVVYISSPMKVRTSASKFRSLVQELTGKNSDIAQYMDGDGAAFDQFHDDREEVAAAEEQSGHQMVASDGAAAAAGLDSFLGSADSVLAASQFGGSSSDLYYGACSYWDVLGSCDDLV